MEKLIIPILVLAILIFLSARKVVAGVTRGDIIKVTEPYLPQIQYYASLYNHDPDLIRAIIFKESSGDRLAEGKPVTIKLWNESHCTGRAIGLMQILYPCTSKDIADRLFKEPPPNEADLKIQDVNIRYGCGYLRDRIDSKKDIWEGVRIYGGGSYEYREEIRSYYNLLKGVK